MKNRSGNLLAALACAAVLALTWSASAAHATPWRFSVTPYVWATDMGIDSKLAGRQVVDKTIPVSDLVKQIDTIFQMRIEATHGSIGIMADGFDVTLSDEKAAVALPEGAGAADLASDVGMTIVDVAGIYDPKGDRRGISFLAGTRIINDRATVDATFMPAPGVSAAKTYDSSETLVDGLLGARYGMRFSRRWGVQMQADGSIGGTDFTWSAGPTLGFAFGKMGAFGINAGYRVMQINFKDEAGLDNTLTLKGALLGFRASF